jgi:NADH-quinone oxidoreductase subunit H
MERNFTTTMTIYHPIIAIIAILFVVLNLAALMIWVERRMLALWQDRYGPNRVGPFGLLQPVADAIKLFAKEDWILLLPTRSLSSSPLPSS